MMRHFIFDLAGPLDQKTKKRPQDRRGQRRESGGGQHPGLLLQRYLCEPAAGENGNPQEKRAILDAAINAAANAEVRRIYNAAFDRWKKSLPNLTESCELRTQGRLIVGLGTENVLETGIRLHHTFGMPIIPGSALKGLAAHYCDWVWGERDNPAASEDAKKFRGRRREDRERQWPAEVPGQYHQLLFGSTDDSGCIVFHDGWYIPDSSPQPLLPDVMTPHHPQWLAGSAPPTDFDSPRPVPFLSVTGRFCIAVSWRGPQHAEAANWLKFAISLLNQALADRGIGGKTSSGYGRLVDAAETPLKVRSPVKKRESDFHFDIGDEIEVTKFVDEKGKTKFRTPDGLVAHAGAEDVADIPEKTSVKMWVRNRNQNPKGYTLTRRPPVEKATRKGQRGRRPN